MYSRVPFFGIGVYCGIVMEDGISQLVGLDKDDAQVLVYNAIAGAFGGFFGSPVIGAVGAFEYMYIQGA
jgi:H+/Cl- antiporter ClcA